MRVGHCKYYDFVYIWPWTKFGSKIDNGKLHLPLNICLFLLFWDQKLKMNLMVVKSYLCEIQEDSMPKYFFILHCKMLALPFFCHTLPPNWVLRARKAQFYKRICFQILQFFFNSSKVTSDFLQGGKLHRQDDKFAANTSFVASLKRVDVYTTFKSLWKSLHYRQRQPQILNSTRRNDIAKA